MSSHIEKKRQNLKLVLIKKTKMIPKFPTIKNTPDNIYPKIKNPIYLIQQFYIPNNKNRLKEIQTCLKFNIKNKLFNKIILLNEKIYSKEELNLNEEEIKNIKQINIGHRLMYSDIFLHVNKLKLNGYIIFANSDMFYDNSIKNIFTSSISRRPLVQCLGRYEVTELNEDKFKFKFDTFLGINGQDTWIYHSKFNPKKEIINQFNFNLGKYGCDNHLVYNFYTNGYSIKNEYDKYKSYHYHMEDYKTYSNTDEFDGKWIKISPLIKNI